MMNVTVIAVGKLKERYLTDGCSEYLKRLGTLCAVTMIEIPEERAPETPSPAQIAAVLEKEGERILAKIPRGAYVVSLCIEGTELDSPAFAGKLEKQAVAGSSHFVFVVGGSFGLSRKVKEFSDFRLSMSRMTFPHQVARMVLLEQVYRCFQIMNHTKYHK